MKMDYNGGRNHKTRSRPTGASSPFWKLIRVRSGEKRVATPVMERARAGMLSVFAHLLWFSRKQRKHMGEALARPLSTLLWSGCP